MPLLTSAFVAEAQPPGWIASLYLAVLLWPAPRVAWRSPRAGGWQAQALPLLLATLVVLAVFDALLNSFIFFPAVTAAGGLAAAQEDEHAGP